MESRKRSYLGVSLSVILALFYQAASLIPVSFPALASLFPTKVSLAAQQPKGKKVELTAKRKKNSKTFLNEDGTLTAEISQVPVHYKDKNGRLKPIDTSLVKDSDGFTSSENSLEVDFNNDADNLVNITTKEGNSSLTYKALEGKNQLSPVKKADSKLTYENYKEGADLSYEVQEGRLKEEIVLNKPPADSTFAFEIDLKGLKPKLQEDGSINLTDNKDKTSLVIEPPFMSDASASDIFAPPDMHTSSEVDMSLEQKQANTYVLKLVADKEWLEAEERVYPVKIDPIFSVPNTSTEDTYIRSDFPTTQFSPNYGYMYVGGWRDSCQTKSLMKFDLSEIPEGASVTSATLNLTARTSNLNAGDYNKGKTNTRVYRTTSNWNTANNNVTWANYASKYTTLLAQKPDDDPTFTVTNTVKDWIAGTYPNYGFTLDNTSAVKLLDDSTPGGTLSPNPWYWTTSPVHSGKYAHREPNKSGYHRHLYVGGANFFIPNGSWIRTYIYPSSVYRPREVMLQFYISDWGHRAYWGYNLINYGTNGTASRYKMGGIPASGAYDNIDTYAPYIGISNQMLKGMAFSLYDGYAVFDDVINWRSASFYTKEASVSASAKPTLNITYNAQSLGREDYKTYKEYSGVSVDSQTGNLLVEAADVQIGGRGPGTSVSRTYNSQDTSSSIFGRGFSSYPNSQRVTYNGKQALVTTASGATYTYTQQADGSFKRAAGVSEDLIKNPDNTFTLKDKEGNQTLFDTSGKLIKETDKNDSATVYSYNEAGNIQTIKDANDRVTTFTYNTEGLVSKITDFAGRAVNYEYDTAGRLISTSILNPATQQTSKLATYTYDANNRLSSITLPNNASTSITYDSQGRATTITNPLGNKMSFNYQTSGVYDDTNTKNREASYTTVTDANGNKYTYYMTTAGLVTKIVDPMGPSSDPTTPEADFPNDEQIEATAISDFTAFEESAEVEALEAEEDLPDPTIEDISSQGSTTYSEYDSNYNLEKQVEKDGSTTTYTYDDNNNLLTQTTSAGTTTYTYNEANQLTSTSIYDPATQQTSQQATNTYDSKGNLLSTTDAEGNTTSNTYDEYGNQITSTDAKGNVTTNEYDEYGNLVKTTDAEGVVNTYTYDEFGNQLTETLATGATTKTTYDKLGRELTKESAPVEDGSYSLTKNYYDSVGNKTKEEVYEVKADGSQTLKSSTSYEFDLASQLTKVTQFPSPLGGEGQGEESTTYTYDSNGNKLTETNPLGGVTTYTYDPLNRVVKETAPDGNFTAYKYDSGENIVKEGTPEGTTVTLIDKEGNEVATASPDGSVTKTIYDSEGNEELTADALNNLTDLDYDLNGNITEVTDALGNRTSYNYDANQNEVATIAPDNTTVASSYNQADEVITETDQTGEQTITNYNSSSEESKIIQPNDKNQTIAYDTAGNTIEVNAEDSTNNSSNIQTTYDALGNPTSTTTTDPQTNTTETKTNITYDSANRITSITDLLGITINFEYDAAGNLTKLSDSTGATTYTYNTSSALTSLTDFNNQTTTFNYDTSGNLTNIALPNGVQTNTSYDAWAKVINLTNKKGTDTISGYSYAYDLNGNITSTYDREGSTIYAYDTLNRLTQVTNKDASQTAYTYDEQGNRLSKTDSAGITYYTYNEANELTSTSTFNPATQQTSNLATYSYDSNGNLTMKNSSAEGLTTYAYDNKNQLVKVTTPDGTEVEYTYDGEGKRYSKKVTSSTGEVISERYYHYDAEGNIVSETDKDKNVLVKYMRDTSGKAISMAQYPQTQDPSPETQTYYFIYNAHGDVTALTDSQGNTVATYTYDEFGNLKSSTPADGGASGSIYNPLRYSGANNAYYDSETASASSAQDGLYKMGARYYDSSTGRWITRDDFEGLKEETQKNRYAYVNNNPINKVDPSGFWGDDVHYSMTYRIATSYYYRNYARMIAKGSKDMDNMRNWAGSSLTNLRYHFDFNGSLKKRFKRAYGTAKYFLRKRNKKKAYNWLGRGLHSLQDYYSHPPGWMGVAKHGAESGINMYGRSKYGWLVSKWHTVARWYSRYGSVYDSPRRNRKNFINAQNSTNRQIYKFWRY